MSLPQELREQLLTVQQDETQPDWVQDNIRRRICVAEKQPLYYTKYIEADGIAIMGNSEVMNYEMLIAQDIVLRMTAKRPEIREWLTPEWGQRVILASVKKSLLEIPELVCNEPDEIKNCGFYRAFFIVTDMWEN